jgi:hypothetical protein
MTNVTRPPGARTANNTNAVVGPGGILLGIKHFTTPGTNSRIVNGLRRVANVGIIEPLNIVNGLVQGLVATPGYVAEQAWTLGYSAVKGAFAASATPITPSYGKKNKPLYQPGGTGINGGGGGGGGGNKGGAGNPPVIPIQADPDQSYSWNLPPHEWSLPVDPSDINGDISSPTTDSHSLRRGKIFLARKYVGTTATTDAKTGAKTFDRQGKNNYGFQFLWNPETFSQSTSVNWGITPNQNDATAILTGLTNANSTIDFTIRIDRTNDFAASKSSNIQELYKYYKKGQAPKSDTDFANNMELKIKDLLARGTEADLEFLYKTINGDGYKTQWGTTTSNISFLLPTIIRLDLGPQRLVGMIQSVNVNHLAFTREMVPIRTDVQLSIDLRTAAGLTTSNFGVDPNAASSVTTQ